jgi:hypothetical protein
MSQDLIAKKPPTSGGATGTICGRTGLYKASDGKITAVLLIKKGDAFPPFVGASGTTKTTWYAVTEGTDGARTGFESVTVAAGTV